MKWISRLFNEHKFARRATLVWACWLITLTVDRFWDHLKDVQSHHITVVLGIIGILATVIGFYQWHRKQDDDHASISADDSQ